MIGGELSQTHTQMDGAELQHGWAGYATLPSASSGSALVTNISKANMAASGKLFLGMASHAGDLPKLLWDS